MNRKTLLDEFAMAALTGLLSDPGLDIPAQDMAATCYNQAEAMMAERAKRMPQPEPEPAPEPGPQAELAEPDQQAFAQRVWRYTQDHKSQRVTCTQVYQAVTECVARPKQTALLYVGQILRGLGFKRVRSGGKDYYQL